MTLPLMVLAVFAVAAGWVGIPKEFPVLGAFSTNPFHHYIGSLAEALHIEAAELPFSAVPLLTSLVVALGGLVLGWLVYRGGSRGPATMPRPRSTSIRWRNRSAGSNGAAEQILLR